MSEPVRALFSNPLPEGLSPAVRDRVLLSGDYAEVPYFELEPLFDQTDWELDAYVAAACADGGRFVNVECGLGISPLRYCLMLASTREAKMCLDAGADIGQADRQGVIPLHALLRAKAPIEIIRWVVERDRKWLLRQDDVGNDAFSVALKARHYPATEFLLGAGGVIGKVAANLGIHVSRALLDPVCPETVKRSLRRVAG